ncbi:MAG TPA: hypothetical protein VGL94_05725 [Ktedonobacteraceae bacterium]
MSTGSDRQRIPTGSDRQRIPTGTSTGESWQAGRDSTQRTPDTSQRATISQVLGTLAFSDTSTQHGSAIPGLSSGMEARVMHLPNTTGYARDVSPIPPEIAEEAYRVLEGVNTERIGNPARLETDDALKKHIAERLEYAKEQKEQRERDNAERREREREREETGEKRRMRIGAIIGLDAKVGTIKRDVNRKKNSNLRQEEKIYEIMNLYVQLGGINKIRRAFYKPFELPDADQLDEHNKAMGLETSVQRCTRYINETLRSLGMQNSPSLRNVTHNFHIEPTLWERHNALR